MTSKVAPCNYAALLGKVFDIEPEAILTRWGFPDGHRRCECGRELSRWNKSGVCQLCIRKSRYIMVTCEECGLLSPRRESRILWFMGKKGYNHIWCGKVCQGKWLGREHRRSRKYDHEAIWAMHLKTGYGGRRLASLLGIPVNSIYTIFYQSRRKLRVQQTDAMKLVVTA